MQRRPKPSTKPKRSRSTAVTGTTARLSVSLPADLAHGLDRLTAQKGHPTRSHTVCELIRKGLIEEASGEDLTLMAGTLTVVYDATHPRVLIELNRIEQGAIDEVISSQHVLLEGGAVMEVILLQGPVGKLSAITRSIQALKGVSLATLVLTSQLLPPIHSR